MLDHLEGLPVPQRDALATVFGRSAGPPPDPFLLGLATLTLLAEVAEQQPLVCIVDDAQLLDQASAQIIGFVGRRLLAVAFLLVLQPVVRGGQEDVPLPVVRGLGGDDLQRMARVLGPPGEKMQMMRWTIPALDHAERVELLQAMRQAPAAVFEGVLAVARTHLRASDFTRLEKALALREVDAIVS